MHTLEVGRELYRKRREQTSRLCLAHSDAVQPSLAVAQLCSCQVETQTIKTAASLMRVALALQQPAETACKQPASGRRGTSSLYLAHVRRCGAAALSVAPRTHKARPQHLLVRFRASPMCARLSSGPARTAHSSSPVVAHRNRAHRLAGSGCSSCPLATRPAYAAQNFEPPGLGRLCDSRVAARDWSSGRCRVQSIPQPRAELTSWTRLRREPGSQLAPKVGVARLAAAPERSVRLHKHAAQPMRRTAISHEHGPQSAPSKRCP
jgi:hypothetical protein